MDGRQIIGERAPIASLSAQIEPISVHRRNPQETRIGFEIFPAAPRAIVSKVVEIPNRERHELLVVLQDMILVKLRRGGCAGGKFGRVRSTVASVVPLVNSLEARIGASVMSVLALKGAFVTSIVGCVTQAENRQTAHIPQISRFDIFHATDHPRSYLSHYSAGHLFAIGPNSFGTIGVDLLPNTCEYEAPLRGVPFPHQG